ncbi:hypothetical protein PSN45_003399 [Yamadazyma tenuis]|uniref:uncharacterized protein n=1 Tax=Candida tenuis TaxID=2315449 RepID=UPI00279DE542|nr:hypothetical protein PSN45_003399 [Yamadazyma tenuis]
MDVFSASDAMSSVESSNIFEVLFTKFKGAILAQGESADMSPYRIMSFLTYCYSWYGIACLVISVILNRTLVVASTNTSRIQQSMAYRRRNLLTNGSKTEFLKSASQFCFRMGSIAVLLYNAYNVLVALNVMAVLRGREDVLFFRLLKYTGWFEYDTETDNRFLKAPKTQVMIGPSTDVYWPVFLGFCLSAYMETFASVINGEKPYTEAGLTLFEHSLAFQESSQTKAIFLGDPNLVRRPTEEMLIVCLFSTLNHLNIQIGGLINRNKYRLIPSSIIGIGMLTYFTQSVYYGTWSKFPIIVIGSLSPQLLMVSIIFLSFSIFSMAVLAIGFNLKDLNYASFFTNSENDPDFQGNTLFRLSDDFYTMLMNLGMLSVTSAGKSSYITELSIATVDGETWLDRSIWQKYKNSLNGFKSNRNLSGSGLVDYLKNEKKGYSNLITEPSKSLVTGDQGAGKEYDPYGLDDATVLKRRIIYSQMMLMNLFELFKGLLFNKLFRWRKKPEIEPIYDATGEEVYEQFEQRRQRLPSFLRKFVRPRSKPQAKSEKLVELDNITDDELAYQYVNLLKEKNISEVDNSRDFNITDVDDIESESDAESIIINDDDVVEFISPESFQELIGDTNGMQILHYHMKNQDRIMTRAQYRAVSSRTEELKDETTKLIEILLSKRQGYLQEVLNGSNVPIQASDEENNLSSLLAYIH